MKKQSLVFSLAILFFSVQKVNAQTLDRGPYLQSLNSNSIYIHWRTDSATDSKVWYGDDPDNLNQTLTSPSSVTDHEMYIPGLLPNTIYYYAVGDNNGEMAGGDSDHYFKTSPLSNDPVRIWVLGDAGTGNDNQRAVRDAYYGYVGSNHIDMMLLLGDNAYSDGTQEEYQESWFENMFEDRLINSVMWPTFGNHDAESANSNTQTGPYYEIFNLPTNGQSGGVASGTEAYYSFDYGNTHVISLNSHDIDASPNSPMIQWLQSDVNANTKDWLIAIFHHPGYRGQVYEMEANALPILEAGGADLVIWGHYHRYERTFFINGHYGLPNSFDPETMTIDDGDGRVNGDGAYLKTINGPGTVYVTAGSSGTVSSGNSSHPIIAHNAGVLGSVDIQVNDLQLDLKFIDSNGGIEDYFTIIKADGPPTVNITYPPENSFFANPETIIIEAEASDNGSISSVEFFIDDNSIGFDNSYPYTKPWTMPGTGSFEIKVLATDNDNFSSFKTVTIQVGDGAVCAEVNASDDDAEEDTSGGISKTSSDLELIEEDTDQTIGIRFTGLNIPNEAVINSAFIQFTCDESENINPCNLVIYAEDTDDASTFSSNSFNVSSRPKTSASVIWSPPDWLIEGESGPDQKTIDISTVIQEVVDRPGFDINSSIAIIIEGTGKRVAESFDGSAPAELCIEFSINGPLPIELLSFNAKVKDDDIALFWNTASEKNNDFFMLERSRDGLSFEEIKKIPGQGTTSETISYNYLDRNPNMGINYYRLKQTDFDGSYTYSDIVNAEIDDDNYIRVYPSKVKDFVTIEKSTSVKNELTIFVQDINGKPFGKYKMQNRVYKKEISVVDLIPGVYIISVYNNDSVENFKILKM